MDLEIIPINLSMPFNISRLHAYLLKTEGRFYLIDTGFTNSRNRLPTILMKLGCHPGDLKLIILTHGDFDHTGNANYLRQQFNAKIAMHRGDIGMLEQGDMFYNRKVGSTIMKSLMGTLFRMNLKNRGTPDILLEDGSSLSNYGLEAQVLNTPGHSTGSICILTNRGDLFCGDIFTNSLGKPMLNRMLYDQTAGISSLERLKTMPIKTVYPGHGAPFGWEGFLNS